jgi:hypothetical protein
VGVVWRKPAAKSRAVQDLSGAPVPMKWYDIGGRLLLFAMTLWLLDKADSSNAQVCLVLGTVIIFFFSRSSMGKQGLIRNLGWYTLLVVCTVLFVYLVPGVLAALLESIGEDPTLTGRVELWTDLLAVPNSELFGAGYQSFWLGSAIETIWAKYYFKPNQAHNGYIDSYLNLGTVGLTLLFALLISAGARLRRRMLDKEPLAVLLFALLAFVVFYNWSEAMFSNLTPAWFMTCWPRCGTPSSAKRSPRPRSAGRSTGARCPHRRRRRVASVRGAHESLEPHDPRPQPLPALGRRVAVPPAAGHAQRSALCVVHVRRLSGVGAAHRGRDPAQPRRARHVLRGVRTHGHRRAHRPHLHHARPRAAAVARP